MIQMRDGFCEGMVWWLLRDERYSLRVGKWFEEEGWRQRKRDMV